jgi:hypothetical protein
MNINLRIYQQIFEENRNGPNWIVMDLGKTDS